MTDHLLQQDSFRIELETGFQFLVLESSVAGPWTVSLTDAVAGDVTPSDAATYGLSMTDALVGSVSGDDEG